MCQRNATKLKFFIGRIDSGSGEGPRQKSPDPGQLLGGRAKADEQKNGQRDSKNNQQLRAESRPGNGLAEPEDAFRFGWRIQFADAQEQIAAGKAAPDKSSEQENTAGGEGGSGEKLLRAPTGLGKGVVERFPISQNGRDREPAEAHNRDGKQKSGERAEANRAIDHDGDNDEQRRLPNG